MAREKAREANPKATTKTKPRELLTAAPKLVSRDAAPTAATTTRNRFFVSWALRALARALERKPRESSCLLLVVMCQVVPCSRGRLSLHRSAHSGQSFHSSQNQQQSGWPARGTRTQPANWRGSWAMMIQSSLAWFSPSRLRTFSLQLLRLVFSSVRAATRRQRVAGQTAASPPSPILNGFSLAS